MWRTSIGTLRERFASFVGSFVAIVLAVVLGVVCGVLLDSSDRAVPRINRFSATTAVVQINPSFDPEPSRAPDGSERVTLAAAPRISVDVLERISTLPGVAAALGDLSFYAQVVDAQGSPLAGPDGGPSVGHAWESAALTPFTLHSGSAPSGPDEVVIDAGLAARGAIGVGDRVSILTGTEEPRVYIVSGIAAPPAGDALEGQAALFFADATAARLAGTTDSFDLIGVFGDGSVSSEELVGSLRAELDERNLRVLPRESASKAETSAAAVSFEDISAFVGTMAGFSGFIAIFILANTFSISVLQRTRQIGLLRAVGATPWQVRRAVIVEALIIAIVASVVGCLLGTLLVEPFANLLIRYGVAPAEFAPVVRPLPLLIAAGAGVLVALLAVFLAARRAARIHPLQALREASVERRRLPWWRVALGLLTAAGAVVLLVLGAEAGTEDAAGLSIMFGFVALIAVAFLGPLLARPLVALSGLLCVWLGGGEGELARANARANLRRVSSSAVPIILVVAFTCLVLFTTHLTQQATAQQSEARITADFVLVPGGAEGLPQPLVDEARRVPGVAAAGGLLPTELMIRENDLGERFWDVGPTQGVDPATLSGALDLGVTAGSLDQLHGETVAVSDIRAEADGLVVGDTVDVLLADGARQTLTVVAIFNRPLGFADYVLPLDLVRAHTSHQLFDAVYIAAAPDANLDEVRAGLEALSERYPTQQVATRAQLVEQLRAAEESEQWVTYIFIGLAALYAALSIVNTLVMATAERGREFALLGLVGHTRTQTLRMIAWEAGIVLFSGVGTAALIVTSAMAGVSNGLLGTLVFPVPWLDLAVILAAATALALAASLLPAWFALRNAPVSVAAVRE